MPSFLIPFIISAAFGRLSWPLVEYGVHGFLCHMTKSPAAKFHGGHHKDPREVFTIPILWVPPAILVGTLAALILGPAIGLGLTGGVLLGFIQYEHQHWRFHFREPKNDRERRRRSHHFAHHFVDGRSYHGVTTAFWDRIFGTLPENAEEAYKKVERREPLEGVSNFWIAYGLRKKEEKASKGA